MTPLNVNLQHLIDAVDTDLPRGDPLAKVGEAQQRARGLADIGDQLIDHFVTQARTAGTPWSQIGEALGVSKQAAQQRWVPPLFQQFTNRARHVVVLAQERARALRHDYIGTEHLLLGVLDEPDGAASEVLTQLTGSIDSVREAVLAALPIGTANPPPKVPFTQLGKEVLGHANAQATMLGHNYVGTEHILLALVKVEHGVAAQVLRGLDIDYEKVRVKVIEWTATFLAENPDAARRVATAKARAEAAGVELDIAGAEGIGAS
jgi:hypothetical protein